MRKPDFAAFADSFKMLKTKEEIDSFLSKKKKEIGKWWNLIAVLIGFVGFADSFSSLARNSHLSLIFILINAAVTGIVFAVIFKAFERIPFSLLDKMAEKRKLSMQVKEEKGA